MRRLLENAVSSIKVGVKEFETHDRAELLSAVRNLHSGILLLYKEALRRVSPDGTEEVLLKEKIVPRMDKSGALSFVGKGKKTATAQQIRERFEGLGITTDWKRYERVSDVRNDVEHYFTSAHEDAIRGLVADAFVLVRDFLDQELEEDPVAILGQETWGPMLAVAEIMERERAACESALLGIDWSSDALTEAVANLRCAECGSPLLMPTPPNGDSELTCRSCGHCESREDFAERAVKDHLSYDSHTTFKDGGDPPYITCPFCMRESYILEEKCCAGCGESCAHECSRCENPIPPEELSDGTLCGWCDHMSSKD